MTSLRLCAVAETRTGRPRVSRCSAASRRPARGCRGQITSHRAERRSPPSSTTPRTRCRCSSCRPGSGTAPRLDPALRADHAAHPDQGIHRRRVLRPEHPHDRGAPRPRRDHQRAGGERRQPFEFYDLGTATAPTASSSSARTGWRAPDATSTYPSPPARRSCSKPRTGCNGCSSRSRSPTMNAPRSRAIRPPSGG